MFARLVPINCEWVGRPRIAASKFAATINENLLTDGDVKFLSKKIEADCRENGAIEWHLEEIEHAELGRGGNAQ